MHTNLGYQPEVSTKIQLNRIAHSWEIPIFVRPDNNRHESQEAGNSPLQLKIAADKNYFKLIALSEILLGHPTNILQDLQIWVLQGFKRERCCSDVARTEDNVLGTAGFEEIRVSIPHKPLAL
jgi:hypothetical protein